jgi:hypothetical protein
MPLEWEIHIEQKRHSFTSRAYFSRQLWPSGHIKSSARASALNSPGPISRMSTCFIKGYIQRFCSVCIVGVNTQDFAEFRNPISPSAESAGLFVTAIAAPKLNN